MPNDNLKKYYDYLKANNADVAPNYDAFANALSDENNAKKYHSYLLNNGFDAPKDYNVFVNRLGLVKKKEVSQSTPKNGTVSSVTQEMVRKKRSEYSSPDDGIYSNPENNQNYKKVSGVWYKDVTGAGDYKEIKSGNVKYRYDYLNKNAKMIADINGNPVQPNYELANQKQIEKAYNITPEKVKKEEELRQKEIAKKAPELKQFKPAIADGKLFDIADKEQEKEFEKAHFEYVKSGKYQEDVEKVQKENDLNDILNTVTTDLVGSNEDEVISKLQGKLKKYEYLEIEPAGRGYDGIKIKNNVTGESKFINLDNWTTDRDNEEAKLLKGFLEVNIVNDEYIKKQKQVNDLRDRIESEKKTNPYNVIFLQKELDELLPQLDKEREKKLDYMSKDKYRSAASFDKYEIDRINDNITKTILKKEDIKREASELNKYEQDVNESFKKGLITEEDYNVNYLPKINKRKEEIDNNIKSLKDDYRNISNEQSDVKNIAGNAFIVESERGNILSGTAFSFVQGFEQAARIIVEGDEYARGSAKGIITSQFAPESFSEEYLSSEKRNAFEQVVFGLANSGGAALAGAMTGGPGGSTLGLYASAYTNFRDQMNGPEFKDVSEGEKLLLAGGVAAVTSLLEKYGLTKMFSKSPVNNKIINYVFSKSLKGLPENATAEMIDNAVEKEIKGLIANKVLKITGAGLIEYSTEAGQELTEIGAKELLNQVKGKKYFENPKTFGEVFERANKAGLLGLLGGAGMQSITQAALTAKQQLDKYQLSNIENTINNKDIKDLFVLNIKDRILSGEITKDQGQRELNSLKESEGVLRQIPDNLSNDDRYTSFKLINERENLRKQMEGKDPALVTPISNRINEINNELKTISENAVQVETAGEIPVQPETAVGGEVAQGEPQAEPKVATEEGKKEQITAQINIAPLFDTKVTNVQEAESIRQSEMYQNYKKDMSDTAQRFGIQVDNIEDTIGGYEGTSEVSTVVNVTGDWNNIVDFAAVYGAIAPEVQDSTIAGRTVDPQTNEHNADRFDIGIDNQEAALKAAEDAGFSQDGFTMSGNKIMFFNIFDYPVSNFDEKYATFVDKYLEYGGTITSESKSAVQSEFIDSIRRSEILEQIERNAVQQGRWESIRDVIQKAKERNQSYTTKGSEVTQQNLVTEENVEQLRSQQTTPVAQKIFTAAKLAMKALPGVKIYIHNTTQDFDQGIGEKSNEGDRGAYVDGEIHINLENGADVVTMLHEAMHHALTVKGIESGAMIDLANGLKSVISDKGLKQRLDSFTSNYDGSEQAEEYLAELGGIMAEAQQELTTTKFQQFKNLINKLAKKLGLPTIFSSAANAKNAVDFINSLTKGISTGQNIVTEGIQSKIIPTEKVKKQVEVKDKYNLSYVKKSDLINLRLLIEDIANKNQNVWFWVADQLGRGFVDDNIINGKHYLDAGPSFALDPENRNKNIIWASGVNLKTLDNKIKDSDYIFIISGSPQKSKLFNKTVSNFVKNRIEQSIEFNKFKSSILESNPTKDIKTILEKYNNYNDLFNGSDRKQFLIAISEQEKKSTKTKKLLESYNAFVDYDSLRDDFYRDNNFEIGDIMLVLKPESIGGKSNHSTYENNIIGEVVGVPDVIINSYDILPEDIRSKYQEDISRVQQQQVVAPYGMGIRKVKKQKITPENSSNYANLTEDDKGNFVFFHIGEKNYDVIKRSSGASLKTSSTEGSAIGRVGGVAMYYTRPSDGERMVTGPSRYIVKIPKDEVYDFNSDPLKLIDEAEKRFNEEFPGLAFTPNDQLAYITKIADENGYGMTVAQWGDRTRAQTVQEYKPDDIEITEGSRIVKPFDEKYISNTEKGFVSVIPESKSKKINDLYDKIYKIRNSEGKYDDLYRIQEESSKMTQDQITDMIMNSDLPKSIKDEYQEILSYKPEKRRSIKKQKSSIQKQEAIQKAKDKYTLSVEQRGNPHKQGVDAALNDLRKSDWYKTTDDTQRENAERELKLFFGEKLKKAPSVAKVLGKPKAKQVSVNEMSALKDQIRLEAKAAREAKGDLNAKRKALATAISSMVKTGKIKAAQAGVIIKRISNLNLDNPVLVERFIDYSSKVFDRADYQERLDNAFKLRKAIRKALKTDNQAEVVGMAKDFAKIDPSMVEDIDAYIAMAEKVVNAVKPSRVKGLDVVMKEAANIAEVSEYTNNEIERQENVLKDEILAVYNSLVSDGIISKDMSLKEMQDIINSLNDPTTKMDSVEKERYIKSFLDGKLNLMKPILETIIRTKIDPFTGEELDIDNNAIELMKKVMDIDIADMSVRDAIKVVEAIDNFLNNNITSGLEAVVSNYEGVKNVNKLVNKGIKARPMKLFLNKTIGKFYSDEIYSLPLLMEKLFPGVKTATKIMEMAGLSKLINGVNKANNQHNKILDDYANQDFYKNNKDFMDAKNVYERGMLAFLNRNLIGSAAEMKAELNRRIDMIKQSIQTLIENGDSKEVKMGEMYQEIFDKLNVNEGDIDIINSSASKSNREAVNWWINQWAKSYKELSDISLSVYNTQLGSDLNYTPDKYKKLSSEAAQIDPDAIERNGAFSISVDYTDKNKTGVLMETTRPKVMPDGRYVSFDFDMNNSNSLQAALVDINTASAIRQVDGFINSKAFKKLIPESDDRVIITRRINNYIRRAKGKKIALRDTWESINKFANFIASIGVGQALGGINQAVMQTIPVIANTFITAGRFVTVNSEMNDWINRTGAPISNRGLESQSTIESIDSRIDKKGEKLNETLKNVVKLNQWYLKQFLANPDVWVARSSFISYYLQDLKNRGISTDIDWTTHEADMDAVNYAQMMVDRQQNISDPMLAGEFLASEDAFRKIARKVVLFFASFVLNQKARMYNDITTLYSNTSTNEDKIIAARSLGGLSVELLKYQLLGFTIRRLYDIISAALIGDEDDEETKKKKMINATKYPIKSIVNDIISPLPMTDDLVTYGLNKALAEIPMLDEADIKKAVEDKNKSLVLNGKKEMNDREKEAFIENLKKESEYQVFTDDFNGRKYGMIGIAGDTYKELIDISKLATTGEFEDEYQGRISKKYLNEKDRKIVGYTIAPMVLYSMGVLPKDVGQISRNVVNRVKKRGVTENQYNRITDVEKEIGRKVFGWESDLIKQKKEASTAIDELEFINRNGGLTESQGKEYVKLLKTISQPTLSDIDRIKAGQTADQILK